jgi:hypothetical protein
MKSLIQLRMKKHELTMRTMVMEIHQGITQAAAKFEVTRKRVQHWVEIVEEEAETDSQAKAEAPLSPTVRKKASALNPVLEDTDEVKELKDRVRSLQSELETANRIGGPIQSPLPYHL